MRFRVALAVGALLASVATFSSARAEENVECANNNDITVVVDFQELGGGVNVRCAPQPVDSGYAALRRANIDFEPVQRNGDFLCKIAAMPEDISCANYPSSSYYWTYWIAARGGEWCYSQTGAATRNPPPGSIEGWSFFKKSSSRPKSTPPRYPVPGVIGGTTPHPLSESDCAAAVPTPSTPSPTPTTAPAVVTPGPSDPEPTPAPGRAPTTVAGSRTPSPTTIAGGGSAPTVASPTSIVDDNYVVGASPPPSIPYGDAELSVEKEAKDDGPPWGVIAGVGIVGGLGVLGAVLRRRNVLG